MTATHDLDMAEATDLLKLNVLKDDVRIGVEMVGALDRLKNDLASYNGYLGHSCDLGLVYFNKNALEIRAGLVQGPARVERPLNEGRVNETNQARQV